MPQYLYRREDGSTFTIRQKFSDNPLMVDPDTGQKVVRIVQPTGVIFKGTGFYVNDSKGASKQSLNGSSNNASSDAPTTAEKTSSEKSEKTSKSDTSSKESVA